MIPPANRQTLTHRVKSVEHGKPNYLHLSMKSDPQGEPIDEWVKEVGISECRSVMERIRVQTLFTGAYREGRNYQTFTAITVGGLIVPYQCLSPVRRKSHAGEDGP
jgi:hypothetical protein